MCNKRQHAGYPNYHLAIGLAGYWHQRQPPPLQQLGLARLVAWLMAQYDIPLAEVQGHDERARRYNYQTACPGWNKAEWREGFFALLAEVRDGG